MSANHSVIEERIKNYLRKEFPFLSEEEIQESWEKYYQTQIQTEQPPDINKEDK